MELEQIIKLINTVSDSSLTGFTLEEGNTKLVFNKHVDLPKEGKAASEVKISLADKVSSEEKTIVCQDGFQIKSPLVGTFYHSPSPDDPPFVKIGDKVKKGQTLGIVEAMKLMNEIECECDGIVESILIENEQMVEYGQSLFRIKSL